MIPRRWMYVGIILAIFLLGSCGSDDGPVSPPSPKISTEVLLPSFVVSQGERLDFSVRITAATEDSVLIEYDHSSYLGYRVTSAEGNLVMNSPNEIRGDPWEFLVRPGGWPLMINSSVPTDLLQADVPYRFVTWLCDEDVLPPGEYILKAGLFEREAEYPWGEAKFTVRDAVH